MFLNKLDLSAKYFRLLYFFAPYKSRHDVIIDGLKYIFKISLIRRSYEQNMIDMEQEMNSSGH